MTDMTTSEKYLRRISRLLALMTVPLFIIAGYYTYDIIPRLKWHFRGNSQTYRKAGEMLYVKNYQATIDLCLKLLDKDPNDSQAYLYLGQAHFKMEHWGESGTAFRRALELDPAMKEYVEPYLAAIKEKADKKE